MQIAKEKIIQAAGNVIIIGVSLAILAVISYDSFLRNRNHTPHRPIDF